MREENYQKLTMRMDAYHQRLDCENDNHVFCSDLANCLNSMVFVSHCQTKDIILIFEIFSKITELGSCFSGITNSGCKLDRNHRPHYQNFTDVDQISIHTLT